MSDLLQDLRAVPVFDGVSEDALAWMASHMKELRAEAGEVVVRRGDPADRMVVIFEGSIRGMLDGRVISSRAGQVTGMLPYSRLKTYPTNIHAAETSRFGMLSADLFPEMLSRFPEMGARLVALLSDRIRENTRADEQGAKMAALGRLSAGLAHELNNPSTAARRAAQALRDAVRTVRTADRSLRDITPVQRDMLADFEEAHFGKAPTVVMDALERSDREQELGQCLEDHGIDDAWQLAPELVDAAIDPAELDRIADSFPPELLGPMLRRLSSILLVGRLLEEVDNSTCRIAELVGAIKEYSYMDRGLEQEVDIHHGLDSTLVMLKHRLKNGVNVIREYDRTLPRIPARGGELNQVWTNLIDNAVDAMDGKGELQIRTCRDGACVMVEIIDNGPGIPPEIQSRIFEPFFTTKEVGEGTGLGLDVVHRIVRTHGGDVRVHSKPGRTAFQVFLPLAKGAMA